MDNLNNETRIMCVICTKPITEAEFQAEEVQTIGDAPAHADCYYSEFGKAIDEHPICSPRVRRG